MDRLALNRITAIAPIVCSTLALTIVLVALATGWDRGLHDEGPAAHLFQILVGLQVPTVLVFLGTADWARAWRVVRTLAVQAAALVLAFAPVAIFRL